MVRPIDPVSATASDRSSVNLTLRRVATGTRLVGLAWMLLLTLLALSSGEVGRPQPTWLLVGATVAWAGITAFAQFGDYSVDPWWVTAGDTILASIALLSPEWAGTDELIYGGYPAIAVAAAAVTQRRRGWLVGAVLSLVTLYRLQVTGLSEVVASLSQLIAYGMIAGIVGWAAHVIYQADSHRRAAENAQARAEERATVASHLHDSVLQTLALIQHQPGDAARISALARRQERELRDWLYGSPPGDALGLADALAQLVTELDDTYRTRIELVLVGDTPLTERTQALLGAAREAITNAVKHSGAEVSVYFETSPEQIRLFVRDRGSGFEPESIAPDRQGIRQSIINRVENVGGTARVVSKPGLGTEVVLEVPA